MEIYSRLREQDLDASLNLKCFQPRSGRAAKEQVQTPLRSPTLVICPVRDCAVKDVPEHAAAHGQSYL